MTAAARVTAFLLVSTLAAPLTAADPPPTVPGIDLTNVKVTKSAIEIGDLYEPDPDRPGKLRYRKTDIFQTPLSEDRDKSLWLKYPVSRGRFYIQYRSDRNKPETEVTYGPIEGDPLELLGLEQRMVEQIQSDRIAQDVLYRVKLMFRTKDKRLVSTGLRLLQAALQPQVELSTRANYMLQVRAILKDYAETVERPEFTDNVEHLGELLIATADELDVMTVEVPDDEYRRAAQTKPDVPEKILNDAWGEPQQGLRAALVARPDSAAAGEAIEVLLIVENVGKQTIRWSASDLLQESRAEVRKLNGDQIRTQGVWFSGLSPIERWLLKPGERLVLVTPGIQFVDGKVDVERRPGYTQVTAEPGVYTLKYSFSLGRNTAWSRQDDGLMHRVSPAKGEYIGTLTTGVIAIAMKAK